MHAVDEVIDHYAGLIKKDRKLLIVLVTDESGDDGGYVEEARQAVVSREVPIYVIGRQSLFGYEHGPPPLRRPGDQGRLLAGDPPRPRDRRPRAAPVGRPPRPLGRAALGLRPLRAGPAGQGLRRHLLPPAQRGEHAGPPAREGVLDRRRSRSTSPTTRAAPPTSSAATKSEFRRTLYEIIQETKDFPFRRHFPIDPRRADRRGQRGGPDGHRAAQRPARDPEAARGAREAPRPRAREALAGALRPDARPDRRLPGQGVRVPRLPRRRWSRRRPEPKKMPDARPDRRVGARPLARAEGPQGRDREEVRRGDRLLKVVIERHPKTPWADLAQDELNRGFSVQRNEWHHNPKYNERAKLVPKY